MMVNRHRISILACIGVCLLLAACGDAVSVVHVPPPNDYIRRASEFFASATVLLGESRATWGQGVRSLYYAGLTLARMNDRQGFQGHDGSIHEEAWKQAPKAARKLFRDEIRPLRNKYDYDVSPPPDEPLDEDILLLADKSPPAFRALFTMADRVIERRYICDQPRALCAQCVGDDRRICLAAADRADLARLQEQAEALFAGPLRVIAELARNSSAASG